MTHPVANSLYPVANGTTSSSPFVEVFLPRNPNPNDVNYQVQQRWWNTAANTEFMLAGFITTGGFLQANWQQVATGAVTVENLTGDDNISVPPVLNNINVKGGASGGILFSSGGAGNLNAQVQVDNTTIHINGSDKLAVIPSSSVASIPVDHTGAAPNPVVPNASGQITFTGAQIAASSTANVIQTESDSANTVTIAIQRSETAVASTVSRNGVCHFNSAQFTVDANGFVGLAGGATGAVETLTGNLGGAVGPTTGNINVVGTGAVNIVGNPGTSTLTVSVTGGGFNWQTTSVNVTNMGKGDGYFAISPGAALTFGLPAFGTSTIGDSFAVVLNGATSWQITQGANQQIRIANSTTTAGVGGSLTSTAQGDLVEVLFQSTILGVEQFVVTKFIGNITVV